MSNNIGNGIEWYTAEQVLAGYDTHTKNRENVYYSIWQSKALRYGYNDGDPNEGKDLLRENLTPLINNGNTSTYTIKFHPSPDASGYITDKTPVMGSFNFKVSEPSILKANQPVNIGNINTAAIDEKFNKILEVMLQMNERVTKLEQEPEQDDEEQDDEEQEPEPDEYERVINGVKGIENLITESPLLNDIYTHLRLGVRVLAKKFGVQDDQNQYQKNNAMAGTTNGNKSFGEIFEELLKQFPELPNLIGKLHHTMVTDPDLFKVVKKKLIDGVNQF